MNIAKKIYCRVYQGAFKLAIPILPYRTPELMYSAKEIAPYLIKKKIKKVLVVTDSFLSKSGIMNPMLESLKDAEVEVVIYDETVPNPTVVNVEDARSLYISENCQGLIGFGGGSAIDCAKAVAARIARPRRTIAKMEGILKIGFGLSTVIAVPTTAGTGSETTVTAVITDEKTHHKFPMSDFGLIPKVAVLDASLTYGLPKSLTATTGMDALTHAIEAYVGNSAVKKTRKEAIEAVKLIIGNIETAYNDGESEKARSAMLRAAYLGGRVLSRSYVGYCHAVAHSLGGQYGVPHGLGNAVIIAYVLELYGESAHKKLNELVLAAGLVKEGTPKAEGARAFIEKLRELNKNLGIPEKISGIVKEDIPVLAKYADKEANPLYPVPKLMDAEELCKIYEIVSEN